MTLTIVSGAAPGVEQGAIEAAINLALHWQGWASREYLAALPAIYRTGLQPTSATDPGMVRRLNIQGCDGALVFSTSMVLAGVPAFVDRWTEKMGRAFLHVTLNPAALRTPLPTEVVERVRAWLRDLPGRVYVTGPSADDVPGIQGAVRDALIAILEPFAVEEVRQTARQIGLLGDLVEVPWPRQPPSFAAPAPADVPTDCRGEPLDLGAPEGLDDVQRAQLDASIREAERDIRGQPPVNVLGQVSPLDEFLESLESCPRPPTKADIDRLTEEFYKLEGNGAGGSLHVVLDDNNWERECVEFCRKWAAERSDVAGERFADLLLTLTDEQLRECLGAGCCGHCCADYGDEHAAGVTFDTPGGRCPECGSEPEQPPAPGDQTA